MKKKHSGFMRFYDKSETDIESFLKSLNVEFKKEKNFSGSVNPLIPENSFEYSLFFKTKKE